MDRFGGIDVSEVLLLLMGALLTVAVVGVVVFVLVTAVRGDKRGKK